MVDLMSGAPVGGDVRGFYAALGIELPVSAAHDASVRCFANPDAHAHGDRHPSCSVSLETGAWRCWGCDARGGAYDAAIARGRTPREAMDLLVMHGLAERRGDGGGRFPRTQEILLPPPSVAENRARFSNVHALAVGSRLGVRRSRSYVIPTAG